MLYLILLFAVVLSFVMLFFVFSEPQKVDYLDIRMHGTRIAVYRFGAAAPEIEPGWEDRMQTEERDGVVFIRIEAEDGGFNLLAADNAERTASMADADCSGGKDCTLMHIRRAGQTIVCVPHGLVVEGMLDEEGNGGGIVVG